MKYVGIFLSFLISILTLRNHEHFEHGKASASALQVKICFFVHLKASKISMPSQRIISWGREEGL